MIYDPRYSDWRWCLKNSKPHFNFNQKIKYAELNYDFYPLRVDSTFARFYSLKNTELFANLSLDEYERYCLAVGIPRNKKSIIGGHFSFGLNVYKGDIDNWFEFVTVDLYNYFNKHRIVYHDPNLSKISNTQLQEKLKLYVNSGQAQSSQHLVLLKQEIKRRSTSS